MFRARRWLVGMLLLSVLPWPVVAQACCQPEKQSACCASSGPEVHACCQLTKGDSADNHIRLFELPAAILPIVEVLDAPPVVPAVHVVTFELAPPRRPPAYSGPPRAPPFAR